MAKGRWGRADKGGVDRGRFARIESASDWRRHISFAVKRAGEPSAGNRHARFDVAGAGNGLFGAPRQSSTLQTEPETMAEGPNERSGE